MVGVLNATTSCKNVETLSQKNNLSCFKSLLVTGLWDKILTSLLPPFKVVPPSFEHGLVLLATLKRGGGGVTSTRSWTDHLSQNTVYVSSTFASGCSIYWFFCKGIRSPIIDQKSWVKPFKYHAIAFLTVPKLSYLGEHSIVGQARSLHACSVNKNVVSWQTRNNRELPKHKQPKR